MIDSVSSLIETTGIIAFTISGVFSAMRKRLDVFGVLIIAFVTAVGGGTLRDMLIGHTPVSWMQNIRIPVIILITGIISILFKKYIRGFKVTLFLFDTLGLGLFTITGIQAGLATQLHPAICLMLGTITGCFGGVIRDMLLNEIPVLFHKEIYATACIAGGIVYLLGISFMGESIAELLSIGTVCSIRIIAVKQKWSLPPVK
ncbi:MAG: trimeric intracellular cation channel family protein [Sphingobacteriaceae bacterium]|nr:trimeric intracellular cation channel family protein [Sphingobacteriaceae bacterium]